MAKLDFAVFDEFGYNFFRSAPEAVDVYEQTFREVQLEERLGFKYHFVIEHQGFTVGQCQSPPVYLSALAQRTSTIRIGSMIFLVPFYNPMRLAQDTAMVDQLSRGRLDFGAGLGTVQTEFMRWNLPFPERQAMAREAMEIIEKAWTEDCVTYKGNYWTFDEALPLPRPYQKPHPPIWFAGRSRDSLEYAVAHNYNTGLFLDPDPILAETHSLWRQIWKDAGRKGPMPHCFLTRSVYVAETDEQAREEAARYLTQAYAWGEDVIQRSQVGRHLGSVHGDLVKDTSERTRRMRTFEELAKGIDYWIDQGLAHVGSPETIIRRLEQAQKLIGFDTFGGRFRWGPIPDELVEKSLTLFGEKVMPAFS